MDQATVGILLQMQPFALVIEATKAEKDSTRGRANVLREVLTQTHSGNPFDNEDIKQVMDLCISCKACASECPSSVDMATYKAEFPLPISKSTCSEFEGSYFRLQR